MNAPESIVPADHLDLLVTAAARYRLLGSPTAAAFTDTASGAITNCTPTEAGQLLLAEQVAAARRRAARAGRTFDMSAPRPYEYRSVETLESIEVIKACHSYQQAASDSGSWPDSAARRLIETVLHAASTRIAGYAAAPWHWTRREPRVGAPIGLRRSWMPPLSGVAWLSTEDLRRHWTGASHVVLTLEALPDLPTGLAHRPAVYLLAGEEIPTSAWEQIANSAAAALVMLPAGLPWLLEQLATVPRSA
jgi:hypothetical protein